MIFSGGCVMYLCGDEEDAVMFQKTPLNAPFWVLIGNDGVISEISRGNYILSILNRHPSSDESPI